MTKQEIQKEIEKLKKKKWSATGPSVKFIRASLAICARCRIGIRVKRWNLPCVRLLMSRDVVAAIKEPNHPNKRPCFSGPFVMRKIGIIVVFLVAFFIIKFA